MIGQQLSLIEIQKRYGDAWAVRGVDLDVQAGEFVSIVGPSGSGKTSLLTLIAGFETPTAGRIVIGGQDVSHLPPNKREIGMVFQKYALFPHLTVRQNISFPLEMRRQMSRADRDRRVSEMLDLVQLGDFGDRYPNQLSGGQQQRVAVARALVFNPPVILMDEPLGALDKKLRENMQIEIKRIQERVGATVIYVTHDQEEALTMSDRVAVMQNGRFEQVDRPEALYRNPLSAFVADFVGTMNFVSAVKVREKPGSAIVRFDNRTVIELEADAGSSLANQSLNTEFILAVRPEHISLVSSDKAAGASITGRIEADIFMGSTHNFLVRLDEGSDVMLRVQGSADSAARFERGQAVSLSFDSKHLCAFNSTRKIAA